MELSNIHNSQGFPTKVSPQIYHSYLYIPEPKLRAVIWATGNQIVVVRAPSDIGDTICMAFQSLEQF